MNICNGVHCPPRSAGKIFSLTMPRLGVLYHLMLSEDLLIPILDDLRVTYDGPVALARDLMTFSVTPEKITQRMAVVSDMAWPVPRHRANDEIPPMEMESTLSPWLQAAEIPVEGVSTRIRAQ